MKNRTILDMARSMLKKQETSKGVVGRSSCMCSLSIQPIFNKKHMGKNTTRSMKWKEAGHFPSKSL